MALTSTLGAQKPERQQELRLPGSGITLRVGWELRFQDGCEFAVPKSWRPTVRGLTLSRDYSITLAVSAGPVANWSMRKGQLYAALRPTVVREDNDHRFWCESSDGHRALHYVAVRSGSLTCTGQLEMPATLADASRDTTTRIIESIGSAAELWRALRQ